MTDKNEFTLRKDFAEYLKKLMAGKKMTQSALAQSIGASRGNVCDWLKGRTKPTLPVLIKLSQVLNTDIVKFAEKETVAFTPIEDIFSDVQINVELFGTLSKIYQEASTLDEEDQEMVLALIRRLKKRK